MGDEYRWRLSGNRNRLKLPVDVLIHDHRRGRIIEP